MSESVEEDSWKRAAGPGIRIDRNWGPRVKGTGVARDSEAHSPSGILYTWTGSGKIVHTGMYKYVLVQVMQRGTKQNACLY
jgi:hypothetical protein